MADNGHKRVLFHAALPHHSVFFRSVYERLQAADIFYKPGTATARAVQKIYDILELAPPAAASSRVPGASI